MTIKSQGGVFGRNPEFNNISNVGSAALKNLTTTDSALNISSSAADGSVTINASGNVGVGGSGTNTVSSGLAVNNATAGNYPGYEIQTAGTTRFYINANDAASYITSVGTSPMVFLVNSGEAARFNASKNLAFPSGQGIDFSATAGTGTSELFDDYEEGTWTPAFDTSNGDLTSGYATQSGSYTKIGNVVNCHGVLVLSSVSGGTGTLVITGLPYSASVLRAGSTGFVYNFATNYPKGYLLQSATSMGLYYEFSAITYAQMGPANLNADTQLYFFVSYLTA